MYVSGCFYLFLYGIHRFWQYTKATATSHCISTPSLRPSTYKSDVSRLSGDCFDKSTRRNYGFEEKGRRKSHSTWVSIYRRRQEEWCSVLPAGKHISVTNSSGKGLGNGETFVLFGDFVLEVCMLLMPSLWVC